MTCHLLLSCGVSYRTYAAYKSHVYRHHSNQLYTKEKIDYVDSLSSNNTDGLNTDPHVTSNVIDDDDNNNFVQDSLDDFMDVDSSEMDTDMDSSIRYDLSFDKDDEVISVSHIQQSFTLFLLQLREIYCLLKSTTHSITTYVLTLVNHIQCLLEQKVIICNCGNTTQTSSSSSTTNGAHKQVIELESIKAQMDELSHALENITLSEYQFLKHCKDYFKYSPTEEILLTSSDEPLEYAYFSPLDQKLAAIFRNQHTLIEILDNIKRQQRILFSFRDGNYGSRIDDDSLLLQLYTDEMGVTNPIGAKKDQHKMPMVYFTLEDIPDQYRSKLEHIHLVAFCENKILKVKNYYNEFDL